MGDLLTLLIVVGVIGTLNWLSSRKGDGTKKPAASSPAVLAGVASGIAKIAKTAKPYATWQWFLLALIVVECSRLLITYGGLFSSFLGPTDPMPTPSDVGEWFGRNWLLILAGYGALLFVIHEFVGGPGIDDATTKQNQARGKRLQLSLMVLTTAGFLLYFGGPYLHRNTALTMPLLDKACAPFSTKVNSCFVDPKYTGDRYAEVPAPVREMTLCVLPPSGAGATVLRSGQNVVSFHVDGTEKIIFRYHLQRSTTCIPF